MRERARNAVPWVVTGFVALGLAYQQQWFGLDAPSPSGPARAVALAGGGVSDGDKCGAKGYHYFALSAVTDTGGALPGTPAGPQLILAAYGGGKSGPADPGDFTISLLLAPGSVSHALDLSAPLGPLGVAVEIEGPDGLVGGAHNVPVTLDDTSARLPNGKIRVTASGLSVELKIPAQALCPGYDVTSVVAKLKPPIDSSNTITGQPPYTITASISDPAIATLRTELGSTVAGPVLAANNLVPR
jgi:hypothetical protein